MMAYGPHQTLPIKPRTTMAIKQKSAIFEFSSLLTVLLLLICSCAYIREMRPTIFDNVVVPGEPIRHTGIYGMLWKLSRIGERLSPYVSACCMVMALHILFIK
mmetsp:Transcript_34341/g.79422  ORF Transcript_34341/g.79422 Transcript_34341/m.79422 type:complete len:103 (-) Transcript_34341:94-402(-)